MQCLVVACLMTSTSSDTSILSLEASGSSFRSSLVFASPFSIPVFRSLLLQTFACFSSVPRRFKTVWSTGCFSASSNMDFASTMSSLDDPSRHTSTFRNHDSVASTSFRCRWTSSTKPGRVLLSLISSDASFKLSPVEDFILALVFLHHFSDRSQTSARARTRFRWKSRNAFSELGRLFTWSWRPFETSRFRFPIGERGGECLGSSELPPGRSGSAGKICEASRHQLNVATTAASCCSSSLRTGIQSASRSKDSSLSISSASTSRTSSSSSSRVATPLEPSWSSFS
mmetsp:Transcript_10978/g.31504  ORF Transcript_10978/g.31504 Transcript_10978/m.31504 type:complete len:286 (-) Transcript_10978:740-1597(-)